MATGPFDLSGRVGLLTGATGHLGGPMASALAGAGATLVLAGRDPERLAALAERYGADAVMAFDLTDPGAVGDALAKVGAVHGRLDFLVNNASSGPQASLEQASAEDFQAQFRIGPTASFELTRRALPLLRAAVGRSGGTAAVVNVASMYGLVSPDPRLYGDSGQQSPPFYAAAKGALVQLSRYLACHLGPESIRVNALSPGPFPRPEAAARDPAFFERLTARVPLGRLGRADELGGAVLFLASEASSFMTGANLVVDGGWTAW